MVHSVNNGNLRKVQDREQVKYCILNYSLFDGVSIRERVLFKEEFTKECHIVFSASTCKYGLVL